jgi:hypothetical protein
MNSILHMQLGEKHEYRSVFVNHRYVHFGLCRSNAMRRLTAILGDVWMVLRCGTLISKYSVKY